MAVLHLPLTLTSSGTFERSGTEEDIVGGRLRLFLLSGMGQYLRLPSPGIRAMWIQLYTMGISSRFCDQMPEEERLQLEKTILEEVNSWFEDTATIVEVKLLGDAAEDNGIRFLTDQREFTFRFKFALPGRGLNAGSVGSWNIMETSRAL